MFSFLGDPSLLYNHIMWFYVVILLIFAFKIPLNETLRPEFNKRIVFFHFKQCFLWICRALVVLTVSAVLERPHFSSIIAVTITCLPAAMCAICHGFRLRCSALKRQCIKEPSAFILKSNVRSQP